MIQILELVGKNLENYYYVKGHRGKIEQNRWTHGEFHPRI